MFNKMTKFDILVFSGLFLLAFWVVFISCLNPFGLKNLDSDTAVFLTVAQGITQGLVPFRDFVDNKGPIMYLISALGMFLGGFTGVWFIELIFMYVVVLFAYKIALFFGGKRVAFWGVVCSFIVFQSFFHEVAGSEEYALPFMMISLYIFVKYFLTHKEPPTYELITIGICFAITFFLRINMFPLWFGFCVVIVIETLQRRKFIPLLRYVLFFFTGILIVSIPVFLYLYFNNAFYDYIYQNLIVGSSRAFEDFSFAEFAESFLLIMENNFCFVPLLIYVIWIFKQYKGIDLFLCFGLILAYLLTILFYAVIRTSFRHYNMTLVPFLVPAFTFCVKFAFDYFANIKYRNIALFLSLCIVFAKLLGSWAFYGYTVINTASRKEPIAAGKLIDQNTNENDTIISLGKDCAIYLFTGRQSASRYIYQISGMNFDPNAQEEFLYDMRKNEPKIIVIRDRGGYYNYLPEWYSPIYEMIANEYRLLSSDNGYFLFIREG